MIHIFLFIPLPFPSPPKVLFEIELLGFVDYSAVEDLEDLSHDQGKQATFQQRLAAANSEREVGNDFFQQNMIGKAVGRYLKVESSSHWPRDQYSVLCYTTHPPPPPIMLHPHLSHPPSCTPTPPPPPIMLHPHLPHPPHPPCRQSVNWSRFG